MSKNNVKIIKEKMGYKKQKFSIRKLSVGVASVLLGTAFYMQGSTVHADVDVNNVSINDNVQMTNNNLSTNDSKLTSTNLINNDNNKSISTVNNNKSLNSNANDVKTINSDVANINPSSINGQMDKQTKDDRNVDSVSSNINSNENINSNLNTINSSVPTNDENYPWYTEQEKVDIAKENVQSFSDNPKIKNNGGLDPEVWGTFNAKDWDVAPITIPHPAGQIPIEGFTLTGYHGDKDHIILPDLDSLRKVYPNLPNSSNTSNGLYVTSDFIHKLIMDNNPITFAVKDNSMNVFNADSDWSWVFARTNDKKTLLGDSRLTKVNLMGFGLGCDVGISSLDHMFDGDHLDSIANINFAYTQPLTDNNGNALPITAVAMFKGNNLKQLDGFSLDLDGKLNTQSGTGNTSLGYLFTSSVFSDVSEMFANNQLYTLNSNDQLLDTISGADGSIKADYMFANNNLTDLSTCHFLDNLVLSSGIGMFQNNKITKLPDYISLGDSRYTQHMNLSYMFANNELTKVPTVDWFIYPDEQIDDLNLTGMFMNNKISDTTNFSNWTEMFSQTPSFKNLNLSSFLANNQIVNLEGLGEWNTSTVTSMSHMFANNQLLDIVALDTWNYSNVTNMSGMFENNQINNVVDLEAWSTLGNLQKVEDMSNMFFNNKITTLESLGLNVPNLKNAHGMFAKNQIVGTVDISEFNLKNITDISDMFIDNFGIDRLIMVNLDLSKVVNITNFIKNGPIVISAFGVKVPENLDWTEAISNGSVLGTDNQVLLNAKKMPVDEYTIKQGINSEKQFTSIAIKNNSFSELANDLKNRLENKINALNDTSNGYSYTVDPTLPLGKDNVKDMLKVANGTILAMPLQQKVTIKYVNQDGETIKTTTVTGYTGEQTNLMFEIPDNYFVTGKLPSVNYTFTTDNKDIVIPVGLKQFTTGDPIISDKGTLNIIKYIDQNGNIIKTDKVIGNTGDNISINIPNGYHFANNKVPNIIITNNPEQVIRIEKDQSTTGDSIISNKDTLNIIKYIDQNGNIIKTDKIIGNIGDNISLNIPSGYHFVNNKVPSIVITNNPEQVIRIEKDQSTTGEPIISNKGTLSIVKYTDQNGNIIKTDKVIGNIGDNISLNIPSGYHFVSNKVPSIVITNNPEQVIRIEKDQSITGDPIIRNNDTLNIINYNGQNGNIIKTDKIIGDEHNLPQTGNQNKISLISLGLISGTLGLMLIKKKRS